MCLFFPVMLCQWFALFIVLPFHLSLSYLWSSDVLKFWRVFFPGYLSTCVCIYVYKYIYRKQASCVYAVYTQTHRETHVYLRVCIKRMYSTGLKIRPWKTSLETDLPENGLLSTILCEGFCYLVLLSITLVWCLPFASVVFSFLSQNGMPLGISKVYGCLGQQTAPGQQRRQGPNPCFASARVLDSPVRCYFQERDPDVLICSCWQPHVDWYHWLPQCWALYPDYAGSAAKPGSAFPLRALPPARDCLWAEVVRLLLLPTAVYSQVW